MLREQKMGFHGPRTRPISCLKVTIVLQLWNLLESSFISVIKINVHISILINASIYKLETVDSRAEINNSTKKRQHS